MFIYGMFKRWPFRPLYFCSFALAYEKMQILRYVHLLNIYINKYIHNILMCIYYGTQLYLYWYAFLQCTASSVGAAELMVVKWEIKGQICEGLVVCQVGWVVLVGLGPEHTSPQGFRVRILPPTRTPCACIQVLFFFLGMESDIVIYDHSTRMKYRRKTKRTCLNQLIKQQSCSSN